MRILAASDLHGNLETYSWLVTIAKERRVELVVLAGDLLGYEEGIDDIEDAQRAHAARVVPLLGALPVPAYYIMGNDDSVELEPPDSRLRSLHGERIDRGEFNFVGYQHTLPFMGGVNERPEAVIAEELDRMEHLLDEHTVFVTHGPAAGILDATLLGPAGSPAIREVVLRRRVAAHIHGHVHGSFGRDGLHFNVAAGHRCRAMLIDLRSMVHEIVDDASH